jgi:hypothetical protein
MSLCNKEIYSEIHLFLSLHKEISTENNLFHPFHTLYQLIRVISVDHKILNSRPWIFRFPLHWDLIKWILLLPFAITLCLWSNHCLWFNHYLWSHHMESHTILFNPCLHLIIEALETPQYPISYLISYPLSHPIPCNLDHTNNLGGRYPIIMLNPSLNHPHNNIGRKLLSFWCL